jgi:hypothetical protein
MKKLIVAGILCLMITAGVAQETTGLFLFKKPQYAITVAKVISAELGLHESSIPKVMGLMNNHAKVQGQFLLKPENNTPEKIKSLELNQTSEIETGLKNILGLDRFNIYLQKKADITKKVKELEK